MSGKPFNAIRLEHGLAKLGSISSAGTGIFVTALIYVPVLLLALLSVSHDPYRGVPDGVTFHWYVDLFADPRWEGPLLLSLFLGVVVALLCMAGTLLAGRILPRIRRGRSALLLLFLLPLVMPGAVLGIQEFAFWRIFLHLRPGIWTLVITLFLWSFPFALLAMLVVTSRFDRRLIDAASDLGASPWRAFRDVELPLIMPGVTCAGMFGFLLSLTELPRSLFVRGGEVPLPVFLWAEASSRAAHAPLIYGLNTVIATVSVGVGALAVALLGHSVRSKGAK